MIDRENVIKGVECCKCENKLHCDQCPYDYNGRGNARYECTAELSADALAMLKEQEKEIKALRLLVEWAIDCDFGFDQFPDEYERYKDEIKDMKYIDGMIHVAKRTLEDHGAFDEGR